MRHGMLKVVGRLTNWVKLANGKFESLEAVEDELSQTFDFEQVCAVEISGALAAVVYSACWDQNPSAAASTSVPCVHAKEKFTVENLGLGFDGDVFARSLHDHHAKRSIHCDIRHSPCLGRGAFRCLYRDPEPSCPMPLKPEMPNPTMPNMKANRHKRQHTISGILDVHRLRLTSSALQEWPLDTILEASTPCYPGHV